MLIAPLLLVLAFDGPEAPRYQIRAGCDAASAILDQVPENAPVKIRFSVSGEPMCYAVNAEVDGKTVRGYVLGGGIAAIREFELQKAQTRQAAFQAALITPPPPQPSLPPEAPPVKSAAVAKTPAANAQRDAAVAGPQKPAKISIDVID